MVFTNAQTTAFFEHNDQMALPNAARIQLQVEGLTSIDDLAEFNQDMFEKIASNLRRPSGWIPDPAIPNAMIPQPLFVFGTKSQQDLVAAADLVQYYSTVGRTLATANVQWRTHIKTFKEHWSALTARQKLTPNVQRPRRPFRSWNGLRPSPTPYSHHWQPYDSIGLCHTRGYCIVQSNSSSCYQPPILRWVWLGGGWIDCPSCPQPCPVDNSQVSLHIEEVTWSTLYAASIKPFQKYRNGRACPCPTTCWWRQVASWTETPGRINSHLSLER